MKISIAIVLVTFHVLALSSAESSAQLRPQLNALSLVRAAEERLGGTKALDRANGVSWTGEGEYDLAVRMQGMTYGSSDRVPATERFAYSPADRRLAYETHARVNPDADEWVRYLYDGEGRLQIVELQQRRVFWDVGPTVESQQHRYSRFIPHVILREANTSPDKLKFRGGITINRVHYRAVVMALDGGEKVWLLFASNEPVLKGLQYDIDHPLLGRTLVRWQYGPYRSIQGLGPFPSSYKVFLGERLLKSMIIKDVAPDASRSDVFRVPSDITVPEPPKPASGPAQRARRDLPVVRELEKGVHLVPNVRGGFHVLVKEFEDFLMVVDTPAGYHELQQIPALDWAGEESSDAVGLRLMATLRERFPNKPVKYVVLTHYHSDHTGGILPFIRAGATILSSAETASVLRTTIGRTLRDRLKIEVVHRERLIANGSSNVRVINVGENPHVKGMLVVFLPQESILYQSDLFEPIGIRFFPSPARVPVMKWFVGWLDRSGLNPKRIYSIHGSGTVTEEHLARIRSMLAPENGK